MEENTTPIEYTEEDIAEAEENDTAADYTVPDEIEPCAEPQAVEAEPEEKKPLSKRAKIILAIAGVAILALVIACAVYLGTYYRADDEAIEAFTVTGVYESRDSDGNLVFAPESPIAGFIFYPGGKVEHTAYTPLMRALAENGILCILVKMPFNLAVFETGAAGGISDRFPSVENWYIGGHSLGGSMAAAYAGGHSEDFKGVLLLGSYSADDLSQTELDVLTVYGSEDGVMNAEKYESSRENLPPDYEEYIIEGGNHAGFGMYGEQDGDGTAKITATEQIRTASYVISIFMVQHSAD